MWQSDKPHFTVNVKEIRQSQREELKSLISFIRSLVIMSPYHSENNRSTLVFISFRVCDASESIGVDKAAPRTDQIRSMCVCIRKMEVNAAKRLASLFLMRLLYSLRSRQKLQNAHSVQTTTAKVGKKSTNSINLIMQNLGKSSATFCSALY